MSAAQILIVEDEHQIRRFVRTALEADGCVVREADTCGQGLVEAGGHAPDLVILDLGLPDGDGTRFVQDFRTWSAARRLLARSHANRRVSSELPALIPAP